VTHRVKTYGRAFGDPDKGAPGTSLSVMQGVKLKEIAAKASGKETRRFGSGSRKSGPRKAFRDRNDSED
jgi:hypothetical protein